MMSDAQREASDMLAEAIQQMDGILAGNHSQISHNFMGMLCTDIQI